MSDWLRELWRRLRFLFNRQQFESDLDEEMQLHKELRQQEYRNAGVDYDSARHNTQRQFGNDTLLKEVSREMWGWHSLETLLQDIRYGLRLLQRSPGFTIVAVLSLALGIGANTAMFSVINAVLLRPLPFRNADHIVAVREIPPGGGRFAVAPGNFMEWRHQSKTVDLAAYWTVPVNLTGLQEPERVRAARISANFFSVLGIGPIRGRNFMSEEDQRGRDHVAIVSYAFWQSRFSGDPGVLAKTLRLDSEIYTVVGIMPRGFDFPANSEVWVPIAFHADEQTNRDAHYIEAVGRLSDIASLDRARSEMSNVANRLALQYPATNKDWDVRLTPLLEDAVGNALTALWVLAGAVGLVLLIACANVANLMLARSAARQKEIAIRAALGAGRLRLIRQLLTESFILALIGSACGLLLAISILHTLIAFTPSHIPRLNEVAVDSRTLIFTLVVMLLTVVIFGSATAIQTLRIGLNQPLKEGGRRARSDRRGRAQSLLVSWEMALALMLLVGAGL